MQSFKCVIVGDGSVGKSFLLKAFTTKKFDFEYVERKEFYNYRIPVKLGHETYNVRVFDISFREAYHRLRRLNYFQTDVFLICFSVVSLSSFENVKQMWVPEIRKYCPKTPFIIVGTQIDRRDDDVYKKLNENNENNQIPIPSKAGEELAKELKAVKYVECSAIIPRKLEILFEAVVWAVIKPPEPNP